MLFAALFYAPLYWGFVISTVLVGATLIQGYMYYTLSRDSVSIQVAIAVMLILDVSSTVVIAATISHYFLVNFGDYSTLGSIPPEWVIENSLTAIVTCIVQLFFATRIRIIMNEYAVFGQCERMIPGIITCTALLALVTSVGKYHCFAPHEYCPDSSAGRTVIIGTHTLNPAELAGTPTVIAVSLEESLAFVSDVFTTCTLCRILTSTDGGLRRTTSPIRRLFFYILNRGILVTILQIGMLITFVSRPASIYWMPFHLVKSKVYANTLLGMLNSRTQAEHIAPRTSCSDRSVHLQDVSSGEATSQVEVRSEIRDRDRDRISERARVNWDALPVPGAPEKRCDC
ncbi:hypothetical protein EV363DRAFT_821740 [Boletus edulis]|nr:hypothetical protein EV363DRAFT_821740 [Boletus edulis]